MSRLDRLFTLISTSTSASARNLATKQIGEIQKTHPGELHNLLSRLHPLLRSKRWETRIAAAAAVAAILKEMPPFLVDPVKEEDKKVGASNDYGSKFSLNFIIADGNAFLNASNGEEFDAVTSASSEDQKKRLNSQMGFDMAVKLGIMSDDDLVSNHDLAPAGEENENLSAREKNVRRRQKRKQAKEKEETSKKFKLEQQFYAVDESEKAALSTVKWPFEKFCTFLKQDLKSPSWEERHGAATALREILHIQGFCGGKSVGQSGEEMAESHAKWLDNLATELLIVLARDRFGDFVSDQVMAPVRETSAMALGNVIKLMNEKQVHNVVEILIELTDRPDWECRHGAYLGLKYLLSAVNLDGDVIAKVIYPRGVKGLKDVVDDVVSEAAAALIPVVKQFVEKIDIAELSELLWNCLTDMDDLTGSTQSTMKLLSEILKIKVPSNEASSSLAELVPRLFPFFHHTSSGVRKAALQTLASLVSRPNLASQFLAGICGELMSHLFQRCLLEGREDNLALIEEAWNDVCDNCPLAALLTATCPLYGNWLVLISKPHMWPFPPELLINAKKDDQQFLGGPQAQQSSDDLERNNLATRARCLGARMLGKLAGFIAQPVPGFDYNREPAPVQMFTQKILLANLTKSAFQCTAIGLLIMGWSQFHADQVREKAPEELKAVAWKYLASNDPIEFDEIAAIWQQLQTDACDLLATLKYHKIMVLQGTDTIPDKPSSQEIEALINHAVEVDCKKHKIKPSRIETLITRQNEIKSRYTRINSDMTSLSTMTLGTLAGAMVSLGFMPEKLNPLIKPLMDSIKKEPIRQLQKLSAQKLVLLLDLCISNKIPNPAEKVTRNLIHFAYGDHFSESEKVSIISLKAEEDSSVDNVQVRGTKEALRTIVTHFGRDVTTNPPKFFDRIVVPFQQNHLWSGLTYLELVQFLNAFVIVADSFEESLHNELLKTYESLAQVLCHPKSVPRHLAARCFASLASFKPNETISAVIRLVISNLESSNPTFRQGAIEALAAILNEMGIKFVPYIVLFIVPVLGRMSDPDIEVRQLATSMFANLIKLIPLDGNMAHSAEEEDLPKHLIELKLQQKSFIDELMNLDNVKSLDLPVKVNAELRNYQVDGIKWLSFLNRYKLHGILCDDMGLGKTLQTICMLASDHHERAKRKAQSHCASLIVCPATLCFHWASEIKKFVGNSCLTPFVYNGALSQRVPLKRQLCQELQRNASHLAVITSYEIVRSDLTDLFKMHQWNYLVLDEGHAIRNAKTKTTLAVKALKANHRLILSGTPIQNSVLELWSLFDFLMPGFLGSEKQFNAKYTRPIIGSRSDGKTVSKENKEAGVLAMEALHRQVLPFILRRMKEDVLKDLPPKITQDYYCELSPVQKLLYEDFAKEQKDKTNNKADKAHVFQALQYLRKVCNHPKLVLHKEHKQYDLVQRILTESGSNLNALSHATKLPALKQLLNECGIGIEVGSSGHDEVAAATVQHRALVFCQLKAMMDIVEKDLLKTMFNVSYLRLDGSVPAADRHEIVTKFNTDVSIDLLLLSTSVGGLGLNLTGADTVIFVEHDWNPMKDLQAMDRAHRIGQKKVVNVYRLITRNTVEEKILGLQRFKLKTANSVITRDNSSLSSMATDQLFDLFSLDDEDEPIGGAAVEVKKGHNKGGVKALLENLPELWDDSQYSAEYDLEAYTSSQ